jgi:hypothetical protein
MSMFRIWFKGKDAYTKTKAFEDHRNMDLAVKRIIFRYVYNELTCSSSHLSYMSDTKCNLCILLRYFMRELVPLGIVVKPELPMFLTSWVDRTSAQCMYTMTQTCAWSVPHLQSGCWYIECRKTIFPVEEEEVILEEKTILNSFSVVFQSLWTILVVVA